MTHLYDDCAWWLTCTMTNLYNDSLVWWLSCVMTHLHNDSPADQSSCVIADFKRWKLDDDVQCFSSQDDSAVRLHSKRYIRRRHIYHTTHFLHIIFHHHLTVTSLLLAVCVNFCIKHNQFVLLIVNCASTCLTTERHCSFMLCCIARQYDV